MITKCNHDNLVLPWQQYLLPVMASCMLSPLPVPTVLIAWHWYCPASVVWRLLIVKDGFPVLEPEYLLPSILIVVVWPPLMRNHCTTVTCGLAADMEQLSVTDSPTFRVYDTLEVTMTGKTEMVMNAISNHGQC